MTVFVFGLDTEEGRPNDVVTLSAIPKWDLGWLSTDPSEGAPSVASPDQQLVRRGAAPMSIIDVLWLAHLNRNTEDAGSDSTINLTINVDGEDVLDQRLRIQCRGRRSLHKRRGSVGHALRLR